MSIISQVFLRVSLLLCLLSVCTLGFAGGSVDKESTCNAGDIGDSGSIPGSERSPGVGNGNPLQYSCLKKMSRTEAPGGLQSKGSRKVGHD